MIGFKLPKWLQAVESPTMRLGIDGLSPLAG